MAIHGLFWAFFQTLNKRPGVSPCRTHKLWAQAKVLSRHIRDGFNKPCQDVGDVDILWTEFFAITAG